MKARVSVVDCSDYNVERVYAAVKDCLAPLGGMGAFVQPGQRALLQVNLIQARPPEDAVCTHPSVVRAVCRLVREAGGIPNVGGSSGGAGVRHGRAFYHLTDHVLRVSGITAAAQAEGAELVDYDAEGSQDVARGGRVLSSIPIAKAALEADVLITLPKAKTHILTLFTGAVKNHLSLLPGARKMEIHHRFPGPDEFAEALLDIYAALPPQLAIMDAVQGMEGMGPVQGRVRQVGLVAASADGVALDVAMCTVCGIDTTRVGTIVGARQRTLGASSLGDIDVVGTTLEVARGRVAPFAYPTTYQLGFATRLVVTRLSGGALASPKPIVIAEKCNGCDTCVGSCPEQAITVVGKKARIDEKKCVRCFCCHELCPQQAIAIKLPWFPSLVAQAPAISVPD